MKNLELLKCALELQLENLKDYLKSEVNLTRIKSLELQQSLDKTYLVSIASMNFLDDEKATAISKMCFDLSLAELRELTTFTSVSKIVTVSSLLDYCEIFLVDTKECLIDETDIKTISLLKDEFHETREIVSELQKFTTDHILTQDEKQHYLTRLKLSEDELSEYFLLDQ